MKQTNKLKETEDELQDKCESYLNLRGIRYIRIPNAVYSIIFGIGNALHIGLKRMLAQALGGIPDLVILAPLSRFNACLLVELKTKKGKVRQSQRNWAKGLNVEVIREFEDFKKLVEEWEENLT